MSSEPTASLYKDLEKRARFMLRKRGFSDDPETLSLVNQACMKMLKGKPVEFASRAEHLAYLGKVMRSVLANLARDRNAQRRGGGERTDPLNSRVPDAEPAESVLLDVHDKLEGLRAHDPRLAQLVELRFFAGCTWEEAASVLEVSVDRAKEEWRFARMWLRAELGGED